jgi:mannose-6-phosphate isomerase-like protein (cupin superfamily)
MITEPNGGQRVHVLPYPNAIYRIIIGGNRTSNKFTIVEGLVYMNEGSGNHSHVNEDETLFVINGTLQFYVDGDQFCAHAGTTVYIPRNATQSLRNLNSKPVHIQILFAPSGIEKYLEEVTPIYDTKPINYSKANEPALLHGIWNLPSVKWENLNCLNDVGTRQQSSLALSALIIPLYFLLREQH